MRARTIATVVRVRAVHERLARAELAARRVSLDDERRQEGLARQAVDERRDGGSGDAERFIGHRELLAGGVADIHTAVVRVHGAEDAFSGARATWQTTSQELDGVERIAERVAQADAAEEARRAANEIDDLVVMRHGARPATGEQP